MCLSLKVKHPDHVESEGEHEGYQFVTVHNGMGYRCGYVRVPKGHPWHGKGYDDINASVHGGLTFAEHDVPCDKGGEDDAYWVGFDCAHLGDAPDPFLLTSEKYARRFAVTGIVRSKDYVQCECKLLCEQARDACK